MCATSHRNLWAPSVYPDFSLKFIDSNVLRRFECKTWNIPNEQREIVEI